MAPCIAATHRAGRSHAGGEVRLASGGRLEAVKTAPGELHRKVRIAGRDADVDGMYLRILVHANEHMGQLVAYARMNGIEAVV